uniref:Fungal lipase-type domain-containing protein n=1 Tax=Meloidogyne enterolobii TaxID=390850 RepID=A0A6V7UY43_MELEN|nr:unnamed protein product [Meloidogyne enterolobii]
MKCGRQYLEKKFHLYLDMDMLVAFYFDDIFNQLDKKGVTEEIHYLLRQHKHYEVWITGHYLGGALAAIAAAKLIQSKEIGPDKIKLVTFGQPRTGDSGFAAGMSKNLPFFNYRVTRARDLVVHVPPRTYEDYAHYKTEIFYDNDMKPGAKWKRCVEGDEDKDCANRYGRVFFLISSIIIYFLAFIQYLITQNILVKMYQNTV